VKLPKDATGNITLSINTKSYNLPLKNGEIDITITDPKIGEYVIIATYPGDMIYKNATVKGILKVTGNKDVKLTLSDADSNNQIIATLTDLNGKFQ
uniref:Ig-like domain-containing protein n=1 Tax=Methanobrevibacter smithii TaxID=2173 RepID=UPI00159DA782